MADAKISACAESIQDMTVRQLQASIVDHIDDIADVVGICLDGHDDKISKISYVLARLLMDIHNGRTLMSPVHFAKDRIEYMRRKSVPLPDADCDDLIFRALVLEPYWRGHASLPVVDVFWNVLQLATWPLYDFGDSK